MFALINKDGNHAQSSTGAPFTYTTRATAKIAARILSKKHKTFYTVVNA